MRIVCAVLLVLGAAGTACSPDRDPEETEPAASPNVLVVVTDDQRATGTMEVMPQTLARFAHEGTSFVNAYVTTPLCCPSRASIFTGQYVHNHGVETNFKGAGSALDTETTFPRYLQDAGYTTGLFGKYLTSEDIAVEPPYFDRWALMRFGYSGATFNLDGEIEEVDYYSTDFIARETVAFLRDTEADDDRPWLAYVAVNAPHRPFEPAPRHADAPIPLPQRSPAIQEEDLGDKPPFVRAGSTAVNADEIRAGQLRSLMSVDDLVGDLFAELEDLEEADDTLAIFVSDNGFFWGEHGLTDKRAPYSAAVRVPLFVRWPGHVDARGSDNRRAANIDIAPTILDAAGIKPEHEFDGRSLLEKWNRPYALTEYFVDPGFNVPSWSAVATDAFHFIRYTQDGQVIFEEYYDLKNDPFELENLMRTDPSFRVPDDVEALLRAGIPCRGISGPSPCP